MLKFGYIRKLLAIITVMMCAITAKILQMCTIMKDLAYRTQRLTSKI